jgi:hypothetical protein
MRMVIIPMMITMKTKGRKERENEVIIGCDG